MGLLAMDADVHPNRVFLANLLLKLHRDKMTGVVTAKDDQRAIKIYVKDGFVVFADGIDKDSQLIKEIAEKRKLSGDQLAEIRRIKEKDPHSLGRVLMERKLLSRALWSKFVLLKVKHNLVWLSVWMMRISGLAKPPLIFDGYN